MSLAKEKAEYLVNYQFDFNGYVLNESNKETSKKFAIRCLDEIINELEFINNHEDKDRIEYWNEVKKEIEKL